MKPSIKLVNPHTRMELNLQPVPRWLLLAVVLLAMLALTGTAYLCEQSGMLTPEVHVPHIPNVSAAIQQRVDQTVDKVAKP